MDSQFRRHRPYNALGPRQSLNLGTRKDEAIFGGNHEGNGKS